MAALRPHLRTCLVCRARLRDYRAAPARVAALAPPVAAGSLLASARDLLHGAATWFGERTASLAVRWHQAAELSSANKVAAVAASTAVLAGGGAATVATVDGGDQGPPARSSLVPSPPPVPNGNEGAEPGETTASNRSAPRQAAPRDATAPADRDLAAGPSSGSSAPAPGGEFTPDPAPAEPAATMPEEPAPTAGSKPAGGGEFAP